MHNQTAVYAVIPAAGSGTRMGSDTNKQLLLIGGIPVLARTLQTFQAHKVITGIIVAGKADELETFRDLAKDYGITKLCAVVEGGFDRQESVYRALRGLENIALHKDAMVLIHDGARCFLEPEIIDRCLAQLACSRAVTTAVPVIDTIAVSSPPGEDDCSSSRIIKEVPDRSIMWQIQTPQGFHYDDILKWHTDFSEKRTRYTDDSSISMANHCAVALVEGSYRNIKITTTADLKMAEAFST